MPMNEVKEIPAAPQVLADIFKKAGDQAAFARSVAKALGLARNVYEERVIVLALEHYADEIDPPKKAAETNHPPLAA